jgi:integrase
MTPTQLIKEVLDYYLKEKSRILKPSSAMALKRNIDTIKNSEFSNNMVKLTTRDMVLEYIDSLPTEARKKVSFGILKDVFKYAAAHGAIPHNPMDQIMIKFEPYKQSEKKILTREDETRLLERLESTEIKNIVIFLLYSGLRKGEALALEYSDIDFKKSIVRVNKALDGVSRTIQTTKTESGVREIPLLPKAREVIEREVGIVFKMGRIYHYINGDSLSNNFKHYAKQVGLDISIHNLRHTFASRCFDAGIDPKVVQKWLGHKSYATTINVYTHLFGFGNETEKLSNYIDKL